MNIKHIKVTEETYIYPEDSHFVNKNFLFYLAQLNTEEKYRFSSYIGYTRYLCSLDNEFTISINRNKSTNQPFNLISFKSEDDVVIENRAKFFDLMLKEDISNYDINVTNGFNTFKDNFVLAYALEPCQIFVGNKTYDLVVDDCLIIENLERETIDLISPKAVIMCTINLAHNERF